MVNIFQFLEQTLTRISTQNNKQAQEEGKRGIIIKLHFKFMSGLQFIHSTKKETPTVALAKEPLLQHMGAAQARAIAERAAVCRRRHQCMRRITCYRSEQLSQRYCIFEIMQTMWNLTYTRQRNLKLQNFA